MVKSVRSAANKLTTLVKGNRILMIVCVFLVMGFAVTLINYLQNKTLERFVSAIGRSGQELTTGQHGSLHKECVHVNNDGNHHLCNHVHNSNALDNATALVDAGYDNNAGYTVNDTTGELIPN